MSSISQVNADVLQQAQQRIQQDLLTALAAFSIPEPLKSAVHHAVMLGETCPSSVMLRSSFVTVEPQFCGGTSCCCCG